MEKIELDTIFEILQKENIKYKYIGTKHLKFKGVSTLHSCVDNTITWAKDEANLNKAKSGVFGKNILCILNESLYEKKVFKNCIITDNPKYVFSLITAELHKDEQAEQVGKGSIISPTAVLGENVQVGCNCVIEDQVKIGNNTRIYHSVVLRKGTVIGNNCIIKSGTVIGEEGYGYADTGKEFFHVPHIGHVVIEDRVEIGSNCSVDRGTIDDTYIGEGSKIDNLVHIAHNVIIGKRVRIVANSVICGSAEIMDDVYIAPSCVIRNQIAIGKRCIVGMGSIVLQSTEQNKVVAGAPARILRNNFNEKI